MKYERMLLLTSITFACLTSSAAEIRIGTGQILDLGSVNAPDRQYLLDDVHMESGAAILVPAGTKPIKLVINKLSTQGIGYIFTYREASNATPPKRPPYPTAGECGPGLAGKKGEIGFARKAHPPLDVTVGFAAGAKIIVVAQGEPGGNGGIGGDGQEGGKSGGAARCVVNQCNGGDGGLPGIGGDGGSGGRGSDITLSFSGLDPSDIKVIDKITEQRPYYYSGILLPTFAEFAISEKTIDSQPVKSVAFSNFAGEVAKYKAHIAAGTLSLGQIDTFADLLGNKRVLIINPGGPFGWAGAFGLGGKGGSGYRCNIGPDQPQGRSMFQVGRFGEKGKVGAPGTLTLNKLN